MASSSYWKRLRNAEEDKIEKYDKWLSQLKQIKKGFSNWDVTGGPGDVNKKLKNAVKDLNDAVDGCSVYNSHVNEIEEQDEKSTDVDSLVSGAEAAIDQEIRSVEDKRSTAKANYDYYHKKYKSALAAEREAARRAREAAAASASSS